MEMPAHLSFARAALRFREGDHLSDANSILMPVRIVD